jgi:hypothetical protein
MAQQIHIQIDSKYTWKAHEIDPTYSTDQK